MHESYLSATDKIIQIKRWLGKEHKEITHVMFVDAFDVIIAADEQAILNRYQEFPCGIIFAAERGCWPDDKLAGAYPPCSTPYRFLNAGCWMADIESARGLFSHVDESNSPSDQRAFTFQYLRGVHNMRLDHECMLFQCLWKTDDDLEYSSGFIRNKLTGTRPLVFHGNGCWDMTKTEAALDL